jgi:hypothetical protein
MNIGLGILLALWGFRVSAENARQGLERDATLP